MDQSTRNTIAHFLEQTLNGLLVGLVFLVPLFFLPITSDAFFINKHLLLFAGLCLALILWAGTFVTRRKVSLTISPLLLPLALGVLLSFASVLVNKTSLPQALIGRTGLTTALLVFVVIASSRPQSFRKWLTIGMIASSTLLALATVLSFSGLPNLFQFPTWMTGKIFTPAGTMSALVVLLSATLPLVISLLTTPGPVVTIQRALSMVSMIIMLAGAIIAGILMFPGQEGANIRMPLSVGWQVSVETLKQHPFFGVGANNYLSAYTRYRPITSNTTSVWNQRFQQAPNEFFHTFTETGILGLMALLFLIWTIAHLGELHGPKFASSAGASLLILTLSLFFFPVSVTSIMALAVLLSLTILDLKAMPSAKTPVYDASLTLVALREGLVEIEKTNSVLNTALTELRHIGRGGKSADVLAWIIAIPMVLLAGCGLFLTSRAWAAEVTFKEALDAIRNNNGTIAYNKLIQTNNLNPLFDTYHRQYADVNLRLANSLASQPKLSDQDRSNVSQLVQQAIREAKVAAQLNPTDVRNWEALAVIYRAIINVADGARDWTVIAYSEAIRLDPFNPLLRLDLGGVFYSAKDWDNAILAFQAATSVKPDFANGYYNLALAYEQDARLKEAVRAMQATIQNLETNSPDYAAAHQKLDELNKKSQESLKAEPKSGTAATGEDQLSAPEPIPTAAPGANRVKLSQEEAPPPTVTPTPAKDSSLSPTPTN